MTRSERSSFKIRRKHGVSVAFTLSWSVTFSVNLLNLNLISTNDYKKKQNNNNNSRQQYEQYSLIITLKMVET